jgi:hypothetical protein
MNGRRKGLGREGARKKERDKGNKGRPEGRGRKKRMNLKELNYTANQKPPPAAVLAGRGD